MGQFFKIESMCFSESPLNTLSKDEQINDINNVFTELRTFKVISDVSEENKIENGEICTRSSANKHLSNIYF